MKYINMKGEKVHVIAPGVEIVEVPLVEQIANAALPRRERDPLMKAGCHLNESCATCIFQRPNGSC